MPDRAGPRQHRSVKIAVTGGTGRIGGRVVQLLERTGRHDVVALSSRTAPYDEPAALRRAFTGVDTLVFVSSDGEAARVVVHHRNVLQAAMDCRVGHVVFLSGLDVAADSPFCYAFTNRDAERLLRASGLPFSILRAGLYTEFFLDLVRRCGTGAPNLEVALPAADGRVSLVAREDVAQCLAALALGTPTAQHHDVTGPESLLVGEIAAASGHRFSDATTAQFAGNLARLGEETWWIHAYSSMFAAIREHRWQSVSSEVSRLTGRRPLALSTVLARRAIPTPQDQVDPTTTPSHPEWSPT
jgi:NAD(P)H dehydrogenase (quinone)